MTKIRQILILISLLGIPTAAFPATANHEKQTLEQLQTLENRASTGDEKAQMKLAVMYLKGYGVKAEIEKSLYYYQLAAERDIAFAQHKLARLYLDGNYIEPKPTIAITWLKRAANLGYVQAQLDLAQLYENGISIATNYVKAQKWLSIAASLTEADLDSRQAELEQKMSFIDKIQGMLLAHICILTDYQNC